MDEPAPPHPVFTRTDAVENGLTPRRLDAMVQRGRLVRIVPGLYAAREAWQGMPPATRHLELARTAARTTPDAIVSHTSAAALLGLPLPPRPPLRATMTLLDDSRTSPRDSWRVFHRGATPPAHVWIRGRTPHLLPARTVVDCARVMRGGDALAVLDAALRRGIASPSALRGVRHHERRWPGIAVTDELFRLADGRRESWLESTSAWAFASWAIPGGVPQVVVLDGRGRFVARVDVAWPEEGMVGEADGRGKYLDNLPRAGTTERAIARRILRQVTRESRLRDLGLEVVRWDTGDALGAPLDVRARWFAAAARARPEVVTARFMCSCCGIPLTDCESPTRMAPLTPSGRGGSARSARGAR